MTKEMMKLQKLQKEFCEFEYSTLCLEANKGGIMRIDTIGGKRVETPWV